MRLVLVLFLLGGLIFNYSFACLCVANVPASERLATSDIVFLGKATQIHLSQDGVSGATFEVQQSWKGIFTKHVYVGTSLGTDCNIEFVKDQTYLVYAYDMESPYTHLCSGTKLLADSYDDLRFLGAGKVPTLDESACIGNKCMGNDGLIGMYDLRNITILSAISIPIFGAMAFLIFVRKKSRKQS